MRGGVRGQAQSIAVQQPSSSQVQTSASVIIKMSAMVARMEAEVDRVREEMRELLAREMFTQIAYKSELMGESTPTPEKPIRKNEKND